MCCNLKMHSWIYLNKIYSSIYAFYFYLIRIQLRKSLMRTLANICWLFKGSFENIIQVKHTFSIKILIWKLYRSKNKLSVKKTNMLVTQVLVKCIVFLCILNVLNNSWNLYLGRILLKELKDFSTTKAKECIIYSISLNLRNSFEYKYSFKI